MHIVVIKILQGSVVTQTLLGGLIYPPVANFIQCISTKHYGSWLAVDKVIINSLLSLSHTVCCS